MRQIVAVAEPKPLEVEVAKKPCPCCGGALILAYKTGIPVYRLECAGADDDVVAVMPVFRWDVRVMCEECHRLPDGTDYDREDNYMRLSKTEEAEFWAGYLPPGALSPEDAARVAAGGIDGLRVRLRAKYWDFCAMNDPDYRSSSFAFRRGFYVKNVQVRMTAAHFNGFWRMNLKANDIASSKSLRSWLYPNRRARRAWAIWTRECKRLGLWGDDEVNKPTVLPSEWARVRWFTDETGRQRWNRCWQRRRDLLGVAA